MIVDTFSISGAIPISSALAAISCVSNFSNGVGPSAASDIASATFVIPIANALAASSNPRNSATAKLNLVILLLN